MANLIPDRIFNLAFEEYISENNVVIEDSRILQDFNDEVSTQKDYRGREIFELIQNADDQSASKMVIKLDTENHILTVSNDGEKPFTEAGFRSIMRARSSSKPLENLIGQKGLGFRSILNWAEEIEIRSAGVVCQFSSRIADKKWNQIKEAYLAKPSKTVDYDIQGALDYFEAIAKKENRKSPLAILAVPDLLEGGYTDEDRLYAATIKIVYSQGVNGEIERGIKDQLKSLKDGRALLFLPHLTSLHIFEDGQETTISKTVTNDSIIKIATVSPQGGTVEKEWLIVGDVEDAGYYDVAVAYPLDGGEITDNTFYCFFPTKERNPYHCIVHATFRVDQARNYFIEDNANPGLIDRCANKMLELAGDARIGAAQNRWDKLGVVYTESDVSGFCQKRLEGQLMSGLSHAEVFPIVDGRSFRKGGDVRFVSSDLSDSVSEILQQVVVPSSCFSEMLSAPHKEGYLKKLKEKDLVRTYGETLLTDKLNALSDNRITIDSRARLIKAVVDGWPGGFGAYKPKLLVDHGNSVIQGKGYLISRDQLPDVPDCVDLSYVSKELYSRLCEEFGIRMGDDGEIRSERQPERVLWDRIQKFVDVTYADKNTVVQKIAPGPLDKEESIRKRVISLFNFYKKDTDKNSIILTDTPVWLLNENKCPAESSSLVLNGEGMDSRWKLMPAENWGIEPGTDEKLLKSFWHALHVSDYLPQERLDVMKDNQYLNEFGLNGTAGESKRSNYSAEQYALVPHHEYVESIGDKGLGFFLELILRESSLYDSITSPQYLNYVYYGDKQNHHSLSYPAYRMRQLPLLEPLRGYICMDAQFNSLDVLPYEKARAIRPQLTQSEYRAFLGKLGAVDSLSDLSAAQLYVLLQAVTDRSKDGKGIQVSYEKIKRALAVRKEMDKTLSIPDGLTLWARASGGTARRYPCKEIYYWDNDRYPKALVSDIPKLLMSSRAGEKTIQEVFGVKALSMIVTDVVILIDQSRRNLDLEDALIKHIRERSGYILQARNANVANNEVYAERLLAQLTDEGGIRCYERCAFTKGGVQDILGDNEMIPTREGDRVVYNIRHNGDFNIHDPSFCESVVDVLSLKFGLSSENSEIMDDIRRILQYTIPEIEYHFGNLFDEADVQKEIDSEPAYEGLAFALEDFRRQKKVVFQDALWNYLKDKPDEQGLFIGLCKKYGEDDWLKSVHTEPDMISDSFNEHLKQLLGMDIVLDDQINAVLKKPLYDEYETIWPSIRAIVGKLGDSNEDNELNSYLYFSGNQARIAPLISKYLPAPTANTGQKLKIDLSDYSRGVATFRKESGERSTGEGEDRSASDRTGHNRSRAVTVLSDERAVEIGENAEEIAAKLINASGGWAEIVSSANPIGGTNRHHYDIEYYKGSGREPKDCRYLEVKSMQQGSCELTKDEYDTGMKNAEKYDIAFLVGKTLYIFEAPFLDQQVREHLFKPSQYRIRECDLVLEKSSQKEPDE